MIARINEVKIATKHIPCDFRCKSDGQKRKSDQKCNKDKCRCECNNPIKHHVCKKDYVLNPITCTCEINKF